MRHIAWIGALLAAALTASAQEKGKEFKPQKEHEALKQFEGRWDIKCKWMMPGHEPQENTGIEISKVSSGGFWLMCEFRGELDKKPMEGHSMIGFDPQTKKYVTYCFGNKAPTVMFFEGEADSSGKKWTYKADGMDPETGKKMALRMEWEITDKDHHTERVFVTGEDGKETLICEFTYTRRARTEAK